MKKILIICCCLLSFVALSASAQDQYKWRNVDGKVVSSKTKPEWWGQFNKAVDGMIDEAATKQRIAEHEATQKEREQTRKEKRISGNQALPDSIKLHGGHFAAMKNAKVPEVVTNKLLPLKGKVFTVEQFDIELKKLLTKDEYTLFEEDIKVVAYQATPTMGTDGAALKMQTTPPKWATEWKSMNADSRIEMCYNAVYAVNPSIRQDKIELAARAVGLERCVDAMISGDDVVYLNSFAEHAALCMATLG